MAGAELVTSKDSGIRSVRDLDGKTVAIPSIGNTQHLCLLKLLSDHDLKTVENGGTVTVTAVENADVQNMMELRNIDAALVPEPWGTTLEAAGAEIVLDYDENTKRMTISQRNRFFEGDELEIIQPQKPYITITAQNMKNEKGETVTVAPHAEEIITMDCGEYVPAGAMIRKKK